MAAAAVRNERLLPCCSVCNQVKAEGKWKDVRGELLETVDKLSQCGKCHIKRYCGVQCQRADWEAAHRANCVATEKAAVTTEAVDKMVASLKAVGGQVTLHLNAKGEHQKTEWDEKNETPRLTVNVVVEGEKAWNSSYVVGSDREFEWEKKLDAILRPKGRDMIPQELIDLGCQMVEQGLYRAAFQTLAKVPPQGIGTVIRERFLTNAVKTMQGKGVAADEIYKYASLLGKAKEAVDEILAPPGNKAIPEALQGRIDAACQLPSPKRDLEMVALAKEVVVLKQYDYAFNLVARWVHETSARAHFLRYAFDKMAGDKVEATVLVEFGKKLGFSYDIVLSNVVEAYAVINTNTACEFAQRSAKPDYHLELIFSALLNAGKKEEAQKILGLVSDEKAEDLRFFLKGK